MKKVSKSGMIIDSLERIFNDSVKNLIMDNDYSLTSRPPCPSCGSTQILKNGSTYHKKQKFLCKQCGRQFIEKPQKKQITSEQKQRLQKLLLERISLRGITRSLEISMTWLPLDVRKWTCENCHITHDRDINAAISLRDEGLQILTCGTRDKAYRQTVSRSSRGRKTSTTTLVSG